MNKFLLLLVIIPGFFCSSSSEEYEELDAVKDKQIFNPFKHENFEEKYFKLYRRVDGDIKEIEALLHYQFNMKRNPITNDVIGMIAYNIV